MKTGAALFFLLAIGLAMLPRTAQAHHGKDFLVVQDYYLPGLYDGVLLTNFEYSRSGTDYEFGIEPEILIGVLPRVAVGVSVGFTDQTGMSWAYESVTPSIHIQLTPPDSDFPLRFAVSAGYEFAREHGGGGHSHGTVSSSDSGGSTSSSSSSTPTSTSSRPSYTRPRSSTPRRSSSSAGGGGIMAAVGAMFSEPTGSAPAPSAPIQVAAAPADDGSGTGTATDAGSTTNGNCPDLGPDAPPCDDTGTGGGNTGGGTTGGGGHSHSGGGHSHGSGGSHAHSGTSAGAHDHGSHDDHAHSGSDAHNHDENEDGHSHGKGDQGHHHQDTIHTHGQDAFIGRMIMETDLSDHSKLVVNLINVLPDDGTAAWGYAVGVRQNLSHAVSVSVEAIGDFSADGYHEISAGAFFIPHHNVTVRAGAGVGLTPDSPDWSLRGGVVWRF